MVYIELQAKRRDYLFYLLSEQQQFLTNHNQPPPRGVYLFFHMDHKCRTENARLLQFVYLCLNEKMVHFTSIYRETLTLHPKALKRVHFTS